MSDYRCSNSTSNVMYNHGGILVNQCFCRGRPFLEENNHQYSFMCQNCGRSGPFENSIQKAAEEWNKHCSLRQGASFDGKSPGILLGINVEKTSNGIIFYGIYNQNGSIVVSNAMNSFSKECIELIDPAMVEVAAVVFERLHGVLNERNNKK